MRLRCPEPNPGSVDGEEFESPFDSAGPETSVHVTVSRVVGWYWSSTLGERSAVPVGWTEECHTGGRHKAKTHLPQGRRGRVRGRDPVRLVTHQSRQGGPTHKPPKATPDTPGLDGSRPKTKDQVPTRRPGVPTQSRRNRFRGSATTGVGLILRAPYPQVFLPRHGPVSRHERVPVAGREG